MVIPHHLLFEADIVARQTALAGGPPQVDEIAVGADSGRRIRPGDGLRRGAAAIAGLARSPIKTVEAVVFHEALIERLPRLKLRSAL